MTKPRIWRTLLLYLLAGTLFVLPAYANSDRFIPTLAASKGQLFWYIAPLTRAPSTQRITSVAFDPTDSGVALAVEGEPGGDRRPDRGQFATPLRMSIRLHLNARSARR